MLLYYFMTTGSSLLAAVDGNCKRSKEIVPSCGDLKLTAEPNDMVVVECQICSSRIAVLQDTWDKR
jgi:hypothetical protein